MTATDSAPSWRARAAAAVAADASTGSKRPGALYGASDAPDAPLHYTRAVGCRVDTPDGRTLVDCTSALGAVALGYADPEVTTAVCAAARAGPASGLTSTLEPALAERLAATVPCAERALFLKSGAEATSAAVRLARTATGRDVVLASGYFGWHDWASDAGTRGVPAGARESVVAFARDDVADLARAVDAVGPDRVAAIFVEPVVERLPDPAWIAALRATATRIGAVLAFDEIKTAFRLAPGGYQTLAGVVPDLAVVGKALANGYPLAAVVGRRDVLDAARQTWISSTLASEATALAAAHAVLDRHAAADVCGALASRGRRLRDAVEAARADADVAACDIAGLDAMWFVRFGDGPHARAAAREGAFLRAARDCGVLFKRGAYQYAMLAHDDAAVRLVGEAAAAGFVALRALDASDA
ncbi:aminotransferase class III [Gemmatimonadetes bacterium T265]|nr:aminotransferase class III [Gemmatimonadetes bacterium T265]